MTGAVGVRRRALCAVQRLGEDARERGLARSSRAGEEVGLAHLAGRDRILQRANDGLLANHLVEALRAIFAVKRGHAIFRLSGEKSLRAPVVRVTSL